MGTLTFSSLFLSPPLCPSKWPASLALFCSPGFPGAHRDPHASASRVVGLEASANGAQQMFLNPIKLTMKITLCGSPAGQMWSVCPGREHSLGRGGGASSSSFLASSSLSPFISERLLTPSPTSLKNFSLAQPFVICFVLLLNAWRSGSLGVIWGGSPGWSDWVVSSAPSGFIPGGTSLRLNGASWAD